MKLKLASLKVHSTMHVFPWIFRAPDFSSNSKQLLLKGYTTGHFYDGKREASNDLDPSILLWTVPSKSCHVQL